MYEEKREMRGESVIFPTLYLDLFSSQNEREVERKQGKWRKDEQNGYGKEGFLFIGKRLAILARMK